MKAYAFSEIVFCVVGESGEENENACWKARDDIRLLDSDNFALLYSNNHRAKAQNTNQSFCAHGVHKKNPITAISSTLILAFFHKN
jgi:hypothetical protein